MLAITRKLFQIIYTVDQFEGRSTGEVSFIKIATGALRTP
jgi:hypothetical protein